MGRSSQKPSACIHSIENAEYKGCCSNVALATLNSSIAGNLPFPFGNATGDIFIPLGDESRSEVLLLPIPMTYMGNRVVIME